jgi:porin
VANDRRITPGFRCLLSVLCLSAAAIGQSDPDATAQDSQAREEAVEGLLPLVDYTADWRTRENLSGDWGGIRSKWARSGVTIDVDWLTVGQGIVEGGLDSGWAPATSLDLHVKLDLMRMNFVPGALINVRTQSRFGTTVNGDTGLIFPVNTAQSVPLTDEVDEDVPIAVTELYWLQFLSEQVALLAGKITTLRKDNEFAGGEGRTQFMNMQFLYPAVFAQIGPYSTLAAGAIWQATPEVKLASLILNIADSSTTTGFEAIGEGTGWWTEFDYQYKAGTLPGGGTVGFLYGFDGDFARVGGISILPGDGITTGTKSTAWALYFSGWQYVYVEGDAPAVLQTDDNRQDLEGLGIFLTAGLADESTNPITYALAVGLGGRGMIPGRGDDQYGVAYFYNELQEPAVGSINPLGQSSQGCEIYYNFALVGSVELTLDFQWTKSAFENIEDSYILGLRLNVRF